MWPDTAGPVQRLDWSAPRSSLVVQAAEQRRAALLEAALAAMRAEVKQYAEEQRTQMQEEAAQEVHEALEEWAEGRLAELQAASLADLQAQVTAVPLGGVQEGARGAEGSRQHADPSCQHTRLV